ncbi:hypothetical protein PIB30_059190 [Stylosanthes scabra]|uniref:Uncharacterized protein n=1 Tax=Stylosanthes scabra TaxID=79078 RepID=A0ABU6VM81_9FABA|nr:hypothetical protein [Stylosanthes scabra]
MRSSILSIQWNDPITYSNLQVSTTIQRIHLVHHCKNRYNREGNRRDRQLIEFNPEIEKTLTKNRNRAKAQKALHRERQEANSEEGVSEEEILEDISAEEVQTNMADNVNNQRRTLEDFSIPTTASCGSSIVRHSRGCLGVTRPGNPTR